MRWHSVPLVYSVLLVSVAVFAAPPELDTSRGDRMIAEYFESETDQLRDACLTDFDSLDAWESQRKEAHRQLLEMLGLAPLPPKTDLQPVITGKTDHEEFVVEKLHFQSLPGLYVTGNLYLPKNLTKPAPAILYVCGHGRVKKGDVSYGNKVHYHHHGSWFARNGYVCLTIDTLQLGEIEGIHHGTYRYKMWWWLNRGYTPAGVEAWNCVRALDYLETRDEVDPTRFGVTGRSGGGAYSWWIAAIDERIKAAVPVAGTTDLENHVVDGCVEGHCDCMYFVNTYRWDYPMVAAMVAPRPLLISNTDSDRIFPLDGVVRTFAKVRHIYGLYEAGDKVALNITAGPHQDTQELRVHAFRWLNHHLKNDDTLVERTATKFFEPEQLRVFQELPKDQANTEIHESFVGRAPVPSLPADDAAWQEMRDNWQQELLAKSFAAWPNGDESYDLQTAFSVERHGITLKAQDFASQGAIRLRLFSIRRADLQDPQQATMRVLDDEAWSATLSALRPGFEEELADESLPTADVDAWRKLQQELQSQDRMLVFLAPRGVGPTAWDQSERKQTQHRRRFYLLGQTLDAMRIWDVRRALQVLRGKNRSATGPSITLESYRVMAGVALYAALFENTVAEVHLYDLPASHRDGPFLLNVNRILDMPQTLAMVAEKSRVRLYQTTESDRWDYPTKVMSKLDWPPRQFEFIRDTQP